MNKVYAICSLKNSEVSLKCEDRKKAKEFYKDKFLHRIDLTRGWCPPTPQRGPSCPRHEAAAGAGVREGVHSARLQQWHTLPVPDQVSRGAGEPGRQPGSPHLLWAREGDSPGAGGVWADAWPMSVSRLWEGQAKRGLGQRLRRGPLSKTSCLEEEEEGQAAECGDLIEV